VRGGRRRDFRRLARGLRFRLTVSAALFFAVLLIGVATFYRERLATELNDQEHAVLDQRWAALKGYLRIERNPQTDRNEAYWYYDEEDPDERYIVTNIQRVYLIADQNGAVIWGSTEKGEVLECSPPYHDIGIDSPGTVQARVRQAVEWSRHNPPPAMTFWMVRSNAQGAPYLIRAGIVFDELHHEPYYVALGLGLADYNRILAQFTWTYLALIPGALIVGSFLGWIMAGRALTPVLAVAQAAQRISGSNLKLRIPTRDAGDELDYLILTFNRMIERLETSFQQMKQFSADVSHELRTPITAIRGQLEVALFTAKTTEQYRDAMVNALQDIDRLSQIVRALLLLSQAESGQVVLQKSRIDVSEAAEDLVDQFQIPAEEARVRLSVEAAPDCFLEGDPVQIGRMITNLLSNAVKFTPPGGEVRLSVRPADGKIEIVVEDTGKGIPTEHLPRIFDRFYRVPGEGSAPGPEQGLGLGLSFVAWIAKAHHGRVQVDSTPGKGTRFTITLPASGEGSDTLEMAAQPDAGIMKGV
jgi:heavy metal sensor kinase